MRYVGGERGVVDLALGAEESRVCDSLVQQWSTRGMWTRRASCPRTWAAVKACPKRAMWSSPHPSPAPLLPIAKGPVRKLRFTVLSQAHCTTSEDGAKLSARTGDVDGSMALCREWMMSSGHSCAEFAVVKLHNTHGELLIGVARPNLATSGMLAEASGVRAYVACA